MTAQTRTIRVDLAGRAYDIACGQIDIGNAATEMTGPMEKGVQQASGAVEVEPRIDVEHDKAAFASGADPDIRSRRLRPPRSDQSLVYRRRVEAVFGERILRARDARGESEVPMADAAFFGPTPRTEGLLAAALQAPSSSGARIASSVRLSTASLSNRAWR